MSTTTTQRTLSPKFTRIETWRHEVATHPIPPVPSVPTPGTSEFEAEERAAMGGRDVTCTFWNATFWRVGAVRVRGALGKKRKRAVNTRMYEWEDRGMGEEAKEKERGLEDSESERGLKGIAGAGFMERMERFARAKKLLERNNEKV